MNAKELLLQLKSGDLTIGINKYINPKKDAKFSPNLYKFFTYNSLRDHVHVYQDTETLYYYIGFIQNGWFCGCKLMRLFSMGSQAESFSYGPKSTVKFQEITEWFWDKYFEVGKAIYNLPEWRTLQTQTTKIEQIA